MEEKFPLRPTEKFPVQTRAQRERLLSKNVQKWLVGCCIDARAHYVSELSLSLRSVCVAIIMEEEELRRRKREIMGLAPKAD